MRIALLADIHANREAFEAVLAELPALGIDRIALLGDIVGYGPDPEFACEKAADLVAAGALAVLGNHDAAIEAEGNDMNAIASLAIGWTRRRLGDAHRAFLAALALTHREGEVLYVHANARAPASWDYVRRPDEAERSLRASNARLTCVGHTHIPQLWRLNGLGMAVGHVPHAGVEIPLAKSQQWLAVIGAVGQPRDGSPAAAFGVLDQGRATLEFRRVAYDHVRTCRKLREAGLPEPLAARLLRGR